jgi:KDO2-lipid IV(A) lauroyltransferase
VYWPTWLGIFIIWLVAHLPFQWQLKLGAKLGSALYFLIPSRRKICHINLSIAFPDKTKQQRTQLAREVYRNIGYTLAEMASLWFRPMSTLQHRFELIGLENLAQAQAKNKGVILLQAHFSTLEFCGAWLATKIDVAAVYDNPKNPLYANLLRNRRERYLDQTINNRDIRAMIKRLKSGRIVWYSPDQSVKKRDGGIETTFFDQPSLTTPGTSRMARMTGASVVPYLPIRDKISGRYKLTLFPALENFPSEDTVADTDRINNLFETHIKQHPEQYFWVHKRFKRPSENAPNPYQ